MIRRHIHLGRRAIAPVAGLLALSLLVSACGGTKSGSKAGTSTYKSAGLTAADGETRLASAGTPERGGTIAYGMESDSEAGYCLPEAQLAISGMMIVRAFYDTLTVPNKAGGYTPYLAKSLTHNADYTQWTIGLRPNIKFSDGSALTATVVKNNLDAYRGKYPTRKPLLFTFVFQNIKDVTAVDPLTVKVTTVKPWVAFPAYLYSSSRLGIMGQAQLDDTKNCASNLIGTGPFIFKQWNHNTSITGVANPHYWQIAPDGKPYPYASAIDFEFKPDGTVRANALRSGGINIEHTSDAQIISQTFKPLRDQGKVNMLVSEDNSEIAFLQLNDTIAPFNNQDFRLALAYGTNRNLINETQNAGLPTIADGPFAPGSPGYMKNPGFPQYDMAKAKMYLDKFKASGGKPAFTLALTNDTATLQLGEQVQQLASAMGVTVKLQQMDQAQLINLAIGKKYQAMTFRNFPGGDPDINYVWWYGKGNPVNFSGFDDPIINNLLDQGRSTADAAKRATIYQGINQEFAKKVWNLWSWFTPWAIVEASNVHNILGPPLPGADASKPGMSTTTDPNYLPTDGLATGHSLIGLWIKK